MKCSSKEPKCPCYREKDVKKAFDAAWSVVKSDPYYCEVCGKETDDFIDLDGDMIICVDCFDPNEHVESSLVDLTGRVIHDPYGFPDYIREKYQ